MERDSTVTDSGLQLEHFYYGQLVRDGKGSGDLRLLAASKGVPPETAAVLVKQALIPPLPAAKDGGALALVRGKQNAPFILAQSHLGAAGQSMLHYVLLPADVLRAMGGNLDAFLALIETPLPSYDKLGDPLPLLKFPQPSAPDTEAQENHILDLMTFTRNQIRLMQQLLSGIVQGVQVIILNAPAELQTRVSFIKGLLALLPPPARFGVTFTTHSVASTIVDAQIRFFQGDAPPPGTLIYDWAKAEVSGNLTEDEYSRFITSQLRLDMGLVIKQTQALTSVAAWRIRRGDKLADALAYGSYRLSVDDAVRNHQPVEVEDIAKILAEDPTLDDELRTQYGRHLIAVSLALGDMQHTDPVSILLRQHLDLENVVLDQLTESLKTNPDSAGMLYETLSGWISNPLGPHREEWIQLAQHSAMTHLKSLVATQDAAAVNGFLEQLHEAGPGVEIAQIAPQVVKMALPLSKNDKTLAQTIFLVAVNYLKTDALQKLIGTGFVKTLSPRISRLMPYLEGKDSGRAPNGLLADAAASFGDQWRPLVLIRLAELALESERLDLIDTSALAGLYQVALSPWGLQYDRVLRWVVENLSRDEKLLALEDAGRFYLLQILLAQGAYHTLAQEMVHHSRLLYPGDHQADYAQMVQRLFAETPIRTEEVPNALEGIETNGIKSLPLAMAYIGALDGHDWSPVLDKVAEEVTGALFRNREVLNVIHPSALLSLLRFHTRQEDVPNSARVASLMPEVAAHYGEGGIRVMVRLYKMLDWHEELRIAALELLRRYIRLVDQPQARKAIVGFGKELGVGVRQALDATYLFNRLFGGMDLEDYAAFLHVVAEFAQDTMISYASKDNIPTQGALKNTLQSMTGGVTEDERRTIARNLLAAARAMVVLGKQQQKHLSRDREQQIKDLLAGKANPQSALDVLFVLGGYFAKGRRYELKLQRTTHFPLGERSAPMLLDETEVVHHVLRALIQAFPPDKEVRLTASAIRGEIESLWAEISLHQQRQIVRDLAIDLQRVAELVGMIATAGDERALEKGGLADKLDLGKQQPKSTLEFYRYIHGYFKS